MYNQAKTWKCMPSELLSIHDDPLAAYSFNNAVWLFGMELEAELNKPAKPDKDSKKEEQRRTRVLNKWIPKAPGAPEQVKPASQFATPRPTK